MYQLLFREIESVICLLGIVFVRDLISTTILNLIRYIRRILIPIVKPKVRRGKLYLFFLLLFFVF